MAIRKIITTMLEIDFSDIAEFLFENLDPKSPKNKNTLYIKEGKVYHKVEEPFTMDDIHTVLSEFLKKKGYNLINYEIPDGNDENFFSCVVEEFEAKSHSSLLQIEDVIFRVFFEYCVKNIGFSKRLSNILNHNFYMDLPVKNVLKSLKSTKPRGYGKCCQAELEQIFETLVFLDEFEVPKDFFHAYKIKFS